MAISLLGPFNKIINDTATQIVASDLPGKVSQVLTTLVTSSFGAVDDLLKQETGLPIKIADDPLSTVVLGSGRALDNLNILKEVMVD